MLFFVCFLFVVSLLFVSGSRLTDVGFLLSVVNLLVVGCWLFAICNSLVAI